MAFVSSLIVIAFGIGVAAAIARRRGLSWRSSLAIASAYGPLFGLGLSALGYFFSASLHAPRWVAPGLAVGIALFLLRLQSSRPAAPESSDSPSPALRLATASLLALAALIAAGAHVFAIARRWEGQWDAGAMWNQRAAFLFSGYDQLPAVISRIDPYLHPEYPLLLPSATAAGFSLAGGASITSTCLVHFWIIVGLAALTFLALRHTLSTSPLLAAVGTSLLLLTPTVLDNSLQECADVFTGYIVLAAAVGLASLHRNGHIPEVLGGTSLGLLVFVKNEGLVYAGLLVAAFFFVSFRQRPVGRPTRVLLSTIPGALALVVFRASWVGSGEALQFAQGFSGAIHWARWRLPIHEFLKRVLPTPGEGWDWRFAWCFLIAVLVIGTFILRKRLTVQQAFMLFAVASMPAAWLLAYVVSPYDQDWHIRTSMSRVMVHGYPLLLVAALSSITDVFADPESEMPAPIGSTNSKQVPI